MTAFLIGAAARLVMWACLWFIVGNAAYGSIEAGDWGYAIVEAGIFPATFFLHPFLASSDAVAWPLADGTSFIPALAAALICHPISTLIGGFAPVDYR